MKTILNKSCQFLFKHNFWATKNIYVKPGRSIFVVTTCTVYIKASNKDSKDELSAGGSSPIFA